MDFNPSVDKGQCSKRLYSSAPHQSVNPLIAGPQWGDNKAPFVVCFYGSVCVRLRVRRPIIQGVSIRGPLDQWAAWPLHCAAGLARDVMPSICWLHLKGWKKSKAKSHTFHPLSCRKDSMKGIICKCIHLKPDLFPLNHLDIFWCLSENSVDAQTESDCDTDGSRLWLGHCLNACLLMLTKVLRADSDSPITSGVLFSIDLWLLKLNMVEQRLCAKRKEKPSHCSRVKGPLCSEERRWQLVGSSLYRR